MPRSLIGPAETSPMRVVVVGDRDHADTDRLVDRFAASGMDVLGPVDNLADLADAGPFDAAVDDCVADRARKHEALRLLAGSLAPDAPLVSSCQAASATLSAAALEEPERLVGFSLLAPWEDRQTVECARALQTTDRFAEAAERLWTAAGFEPVWVGDAAGLVTARIVACVANEAAFAVMERVAEPEDVDRAMELGTRYPRGPLSWAEAVGLHRIVATLDALAREQGDDRYRVAPLLRHMAVARASWSAPDEAS